MVGFGEARCREGFCYLIGWYIICSVHLLAEKGLDWYNRLDNSRFWLDMVFACASHGA